MPRASITTAQPRVRLSSRREKEMLSLPVLAGLEQGADLLASPRRADRAEHQRISGRRQIRLAVHRCTARDPLAPTDIVERASPQTVRLELAREPLPRRT